MFEWKNGTNGKTPVSAENLNKAQQMLIDAIYPVGSIYMSVNSTSPATLFGGTWEAIKGKFLLGENAEYKDIYAAGKEGGLEEVKLTALQSGVAGHAHGYKPRIQWYNTSTTGNVLRGSADYAVDIAPSSYKGNARVDGGATDGGQQWTDVNETRDATEAHSNMPPYLAVYMWKRVS